MDIKSTLNRMVGEFEPIEIDGTMFAVHSLTGEEQLRALRMLPDSATSGEQPKTTEDAVKYTEQQMYVIDCTLKKIDPSFSADIMTGAMYALLLPLFTAVMEASTPREALKKNETSAS